jgi:16S rRNA (cytidine1402-2'-O)-methyltransferase
MSKLYLVATPIGNLRDITFRAVDVLNAVDFVLSEDTRVTKKLLNHFEIKTPTISFHEYSKDAKFEKVLALIGEGKDLALVTDAGTPAISDPGAKLIQRIRDENLKKDLGVEIVPIPGPSALTAFLSVAGIDQTEFLFLGFPPHKKGRETFFKKVAESANEQPVIFYESTHRILKALQSLQEFCPDKSVIVGKELTKIYEEVIIGTPAEVLEYFENDPAKTKGEFVVGVK